MQACFCLANGPVWQPSSDNRLIPCGDRSPRSPEATRTPSGRHARGRFAFAVRRGCACIELGLRNPFRPEASGQPWPRQGRGCDGRLGAASRCFGAGCAGNGPPCIGRLPTPIAGWRQPAIGNIEPTGSSGMGSSPSGARGSAVAYAGVGQAVFHNDDVGSAVEQQPRGCRLPVRIRHVDHWIAQLGRASDC